MCSRIHLSDAVSPTKSRLALHCISCSRRGLVSPSSSPATALDALATNPDALQWGIGGPGGIMR